jgi:hypothetical protein
MQTYSAATQITQHYGRIEGGEGWVGLPGHLIKMRLFIHTVLVLHANIHTVQYGKGTVTFSIKKSRRNVIRLPVHHRNISGQNEIPVLSRECVTKS